MGLVGKIRKALKKSKVRHAVAAFGGPVGSGIVAGNYLRRKFEKKTKIGRTIKQMYNPRPASQPVMYNSAASFQPRRISSLMGGAQ